MRSGLLKAAMAAALLGVAAYYWCAAFDVWSCVYADDGLINVRYARNLINGAGLVFNPGERIYGFTSIANVLLYALGLALHISTDTWIAVSGVFFIGAAALFAIMIMRGLVPMVIAIPWSALLLTDNFYGYSFLGLEAAMYAAALLGVVWLAARSHGDSVIWPLAAGLCVLIRPDSLLLTAPLLLLTDPPFNIRRCAAFLIGPLIFVGFGWWYFDNPLPQTLSAKAGTDPALQYLTFHGLRFFSLEEFGVLRDGSLPLRAILAGVIFALSLAVWIGEWRNGRRVIVIAFFLYPLAFLAAYTVLSAPIYHLWHSFAPLTLLYVGKVLVFWRVITWATERMFRRSNMARYSRLAIGGAVAICVTVVTAQGISNLKVRAPWTRDYKWLGGRYATYWLIADYLNREAPPDSTALVFEPGILGALTSMPLYDVWGIAHKTACPRGPHLAPRISCMVKERRPQFIILPMHVEWHTRYGELCYQVRWEIPDLGFETFVVLESAECERSAAANDFPEIAANRL